MKKHESSEFQPPPDDLADVLGHLRVTADETDQIVAEDVDDVSGHLRFSRIPGPEADRKS